MTRFHVKAISEGLQIEKKFLIINYFIIFSFVNQLLAWNINKQWVITQRNIMIESLQNMKSYQFYYKKVAHTMRKKKSAESL